MLTIPLTLLQVAACAYVLFICIMVLNAMSLFTRHAMRVAYILLAAGALAGIHSAVAAPRFSDGLLAAGVALFLACNGRREDANRTA